LGSIQFLGYARVADKYNQIKEHHELHHVTALDLLAEVRAVKNNMLEFTMIKTMKLREEQLMTARKIKQLPRTLNT
jgi:hypothetical protein